MPALNPVILGAAATLQWYAAWITPIWLLGVGVGLGLLALGLAYLICRLVRPTWAAGMVSMVTEGWLLPIFLVGIILTLVAALLTPVVPAGQIITATKAMVSVGEGSKVFEIPAA